jgi:hypothetical protein
VDDNEPPLEQVALQREQLAGSGASPRSSTDSTLSMTSSVGVSRTRLRRRASAAAWSFGSYVAVREFPLAPGSERLPRLMSLPLLLSPSSMYRGAGRRSAPGPEVYL